MYDDVSMEIRIVKKQMAFRLDEVLVSRLKAEAKRANRSLSNYVECILMDSVYNEPNAQTIAAIQEARSGHHAGKVDTSSMESFIQSCEELSRYIKARNIKKILRGIGISLKNLRGCVMF